MSNPADAATIQDICNYAEEHEIKEMFKEYLKRVVVEQPEDPIKYLVASIAEKPYIHSSQRASVPETTTPTPEREPVVEEPTE